MEITEKKLKTILKEQKDDFKNYTGMLAKDFDSKLGIIAEGVSDIRKRVINLEEMVARNTEDIELIKTDTEFIKYSLKRKVGIEEFAALEKRVLILERNR